MHVLFLCLLQILNKFCGALSDLPISGKVYSDKKYLNVTWESGGVHQTHGGFSMTITALSVPSGTSGSPPCVEKGNGWVLQTQGSFSMTIIALSGPSGTSGSQGCGEGGCIRYREASVWPSQLCLCPQVRLCPWVHVGNVTWEWGGGGGGEELLAGNYCTGWSSHSQ